MTVLNSVILYSALVQPLFVPTISAIVANPLFLLPSLALNYYLYNKNFVYFYGARSQLQNMFLKQNGKQVIIETCDDETKVVNNADIFDMKQLATRYEDRIEFYHGANIYCVIRGNSYVFDNDILTAILKNKFVDTKNVQYDFDLTREFTWEVQDLVEIKKRRRVRNRFYRPTMKVLSQLQSAKNFALGQRMNSIVSKDEPFEGYHIYNYVEDRYEEDQAKK
eukprot:CAMPEP_0116873714 /NCGR_PEP_ID=MMETSP0463-20121206/4995_1 /TAXON_ID=181622 /ORGANISM="Strombidinopsis sp, Strain SopsisLIS2011" /LENGTH=221 /DNA_ID=CAMNT_0004516273 /DNA_START=179 /DNA_END=844 /DNA_ORIENTATION=-